MALSPKPAPAILPTLNTKPPKITNTANKYPLPGIALFAISEARMLVTVMTRQILCCTTKSMTIEANIPNAKAAPIVAVKVAVCVIKPGPIADVAIKKIAAINDERLFFINDGDVVFTGSCVAITGPLLS